jgi:uncharacterized protein YndB with AHSA1/START domain
MPSISTAAIRVVRRFRAPPARIFDAWLDARIARHWLFATAWRPAEAIDVDARVGGRLRIVERCLDDARVEHHGEILQCTPPRRLAFSLSIEGHPALASRVVVDLAPDAAGSTLALAHCGVPRTARTRTRTRWIGMLYGLATLLAEERRVEHDGAVPLRRVA